MLRLSLNCLVAPKSRFLSLIAVVALTFSTLVVQAQTTSTSTIAGSPFCAGAAVNVPFTITGSYNAGNVFTAQLSDATGSFATPVDIGTLTGTTAGTIAATIPAAQAAGTTYRIRVVSSSPVAATTNPNTANLRINALGINTPTPSATTICQGANVNISYTLSSGCAFPAGNTFTAQLSNAAGSFASPVNIGSVNATTATTIVANIPVGTPAGTGYKVRVISSNPATASVANTANITINAIGLNAPTFTGTTFCQGGSFTLSYTLANSCGFLAGNTFTAELSSQFGSFAAPVVIGSATATGAGNFTVTIPANTIPGNAYRIRLVASNPSITSLDNGTNLTINALGISAPVFANTSFCQSEQFNLTYTVLNSCNFPNSPANTFTAQLSNAVGSFASPTIIGTRTGNNSGTITATIPAGTPAGSGYRIRVISSNPTPDGLISPDNGSNLQILAAAGDPTIWGTTAWNVYCYNSTNFTNYAGWYTENNTNFATTSRWAAANGPMVADGSSGNAYAGCNISPTAWSISMKRTNFTCGYYQIDMPTHDDNVTLLIDGTQILTQGCCAVITNAWTGFLGPNSRVEFRIVNTGGPGNLSANFVAGTNPLTISQPVTICPGASTTLEVQSPIALSYAWTPTTGLSPTTGATVTAQPAATTVYTVTGTDAASTCTVSRSTTVTVTNTFNPAVTASQGTICSGVATATLTATGGNTYTWSPATGLNTTTGYQVIADPPTTTTYTVTASNGCTTRTASVTVTVQNIPNSPAPTDFGNSRWNVFCHNSTAFDNYYGYYTENNLSFNTTTRWNANNGPSVANASTGLAYSGCSIGGVQYSASFKRTNFTCNYYQIDVPYHDDNVTMFIDGIQIFQHNGCCDAHTNVWTGFLGPSSTVEFRLINYNGPGSLQVTIAASPNSPIVTPSSVVVCSGTKANLEANSALPGATFSWTNGVGTTARIDTPNNATTLAGPLTADEVFTVTLTDAAKTGCTKTATVPVTVNPLANTTVTPTATSTYCPGTPFTLTASGASTYSWSPSTGLSATTGFQVVASPLVTTTYTVTGSNNCGTKDGTVTITVNPLPSTSTFPTGTWNVYGHNNMTYSDYAGYYTENGTGASGYDFNTNTRWASGAPPSNAVTSNGQGWLGCDMSGTNISLSFKRTGFACGVYQINIPFHDDAMALIIDGVTVGSHNGNGDAHTAIWTGVLNTTSQVEFRLAQGTGGSGLNVSFTPLSTAATTTVWLGGTSTDWFNPANWCNGVPTPTKDAVIYKAGTVNQPVIATTGAQVRSITIIGAVASGTYNTAIAAANLTTSGTNGLDVYGSWLNSGNYTTNNGTIAFVGSNTGHTIVDVFPTTFYNVVLNKTVPITNTTGIIQVSNLMTFTQGVLVQNAAVNILASGAVTGAGNTSYIDGQVTKTGNTAFTFPTGRGGVYRPIAISGPALATDNFTAQYFNASPLPSYPNTQRDLSMDHVSNAEYWILNRSGGTSSVSVSLSWDSNSGGVTTPSSLAVARWDLGQARWKDQGNGGTTGNASKGTVTSGAAVSTFSVPTSVFTLGTYTNQNPLPVKLTEFTCSCNAGTTNLQWTTATELNNNRFEIERSNNGLTFETIGQREGNGTSAQMRRYQFRDIAPQSGSSYYRLKQIDYDGVTRYSDLCHIQNNGGVSVKVYPNPTTDILNIDLDDITVHDVKLWTANGDRVYVRSDVTTNKIVLHTSEQKTGFYVLEVVTEGGPQKYKILITH